MTKVPYVSKSPTKTAAMMAILGRARHVRFRAPKVKMLRRADPGVFWFWVFWVFQPSVKQPDNNSAYVVIRINLVCSLPA